MSEAHWHYEDARWELGMARTAFGHALGARRRWRRLSHLEEALGHLVGAMESRDLARAARRAANTQPTASDTEETKRALET